jgi:transcriptional regulator with XRE-family HTH domain
MKFPNLEWAICQQGSQFRFAAALGESESWLSRRLNGRGEFTQEDRNRVAQVLGYPCGWLFAMPSPPLRETIRQLEPARGSGMNISALKRERPGQR